MKIDFPSREDKAWLFKCGWWEAVGEFNIWENPNTDKVQSINKCYKKYNNQSSNKIPRKNILFSK